MGGITSVLNIGRWALFSSQSAIETTGNNIANVNTPGYSRREVLLEEAPSLNMSPGQLGTGVRATEVIRHFNDFIEAQYTSKLSDQKRWETLSENLKTVESVFNDSDEAGLNKALSKFWSLWQDVAQRPEDESTRTALLGQTRNLLNTMHIADQDMTRLQRQMDDFISQDVSEVNDLLGQIADLNAKITANTVEGRNNPNKLLDDRNRLIRELSEKMDLKVIDNGLGDMIITTKAGHTLVDGQETYRIALEGPQTTQSLMSGSSFDGQVFFEGSSEYEYTFEVTSAGSVGGAGAAELKVSIDGGQTWLKDEDGNDLTLSAEDANAKVTVPDSDVKVWFGMPGDSGAAPSEDLAVGDSFTVVPKSGLYWYENTSSKMNITPMVRSNGQDNERRVVGGTLAGEFMFRDAAIGEYREKLDAFAKGLIWEVNRIHSQGAGLEKLTDVTGTYQVDNSGVALDTLSSGLTYQDKLQYGSISFYLYDDNTGELDGGSPVHVTFDPANDSLIDLRDSINDPILDLDLTASVVNGSLQLSADAGKKFAIGHDSTGVLAALGVNTYLQGTDSEDIALNSTVNNNLNLINAAHVNGAGEVNQGDNTTALAIGDLQYTEVELTTKSEGTTTQTLQEYYSSLTSTVGSRTAEAQYNADFFKTLADDLDERQKEVSGVNLDEEMSNLIKYQQAYTAAAKLITTAEEMMQTLMRLKM
jgi:flagellar hook-associated protein 1 FlgK